MKKIMLMLALLGIFGCQSIDNQQCGSCEMVLFGEIDMEDACDDGNMKYVYLQASVCHNGFPGWNECKDTLCAGLPISKGCLNNIEPVRVLEMPNAEQKQTQYYNMQSCLADTVIPNEE